MPELRIGVELAGLRMPIKQALHAAAESGVQGVEIEARGGLAPDTLSQTGVRQLRKMLADLQLAVAAVRFPARRALAAPDGLDERVDAIKAAMELAYRLGTHVLICPLGPIPSDQEPQARGLLQEILADLGVHGQRAGAMLAAETGTESGPRLAEFLAALPPGSLGVDFNPARLLVHGHSPRDAVRALGSHIVHVHVNDAHQGPAADRDAYVPLGRGDADFPALLGSLDEQGYRGYFTIQPCGSADPVRLVREAAEYLHRL